jgi:hypothetical protein
VSPLVLLACAGVEHVPVDLQLDVTGPIPEAAETMRVCVSGREVHVQGFGNGRALVEGLPDGRVDVALTLLEDVPGVAGGGAPIAGTPVTTLDDVVPWAEVALARDVRPCDGGAVRAAGTRTLAVRFSEEPW